MKTIWLVFGFALIVLVGVGVWRKTNIQDENVDSRTAGSKIIAPTQKATNSPAALKLPRISSKKLLKRYRGDLPAAILRDSLVQFALKQKGLPYQTAGTERTGFDCSGFVHFTFAHFNIEVPHSSALLAEEGRQVPFSEARKADLIIFTGTDISDRKPGHVGIVVSDENQALEFVHSSSNGGVKISKVDSTGYKPRFLQVRRLLSP